MVPQALQAVPGRAGQQQDGLCICCCLHRDADLEKCLCTTSS